MSEANVRTNAFSVAGVTVNIANMREAVSAPLADAKRGSGFCLFTINLDHCAKLRSNPQFQDAYRCARYVTADGFPIALLGRLRGVSVRRTTGADLLAPLCAQAACHRLPVFLLGPTTEVLRRASARLAEQMPRLQVVDS